MSARGLRRCGRQLVAVAVFFWLLGAAGIGETLPPKPAKYFNDYAGIVSPNTAATLDEKLRKFERETSNQIVVAVFPKMDTESSMEDFTQRIYDAWKIGQEKEDNGAILFVFVTDRKMRIHTGYGLEGALPDLTSKRIIDNELKPAFKSGNYDQGLTAGVDAMIRATRGEYQGTGKVAGDRSPGRGGGHWILLAIFGFFLISQLMSARRGTAYDRRGRRRDSGWGIFPIGGGGWDGGGGGSWGGGGDGGGGGFSGGGGMSGGGGASGDW